MASPHRDRGEPYVSRAAPRLLYEARQLLYVIGGPANAKTSVTWKKFAKEHPCVARRTLKIERFRPYNCVVKEGTGRNTKAGF